VAEAVPETSRERGPLTAFAFLLLLGFSVDALLLTGLRGAVSGASGAIDALANLDALLAQALFVGGVLLMVHLELAVLRSRTALLLRLFSVPATAVLGTLLINAAVDELAPLPLLVVGGCAALLSLGAGLSGARRHLGGPGAMATLLLAAGAASALWTAARVAAFQTTTLEAPPLEAWSPWLASAAWALGAAVTAVALVLLIRNSPRPALPLLGIVSVAVLAVWLGVQEPTPADSGLRVFLNRAMHGLLRGPLPAVPAALVALEHLVALGAALWALAQRTLSGPLGVVLALSLLALRGPDLPVLALALSLAALCGALPGGSAPVAARRGDDSVAT
jgi:hypothetical protein